VDIWPLAGRVSAFRGGITTWFSSNGQAFRIAAGQADVRIFKAFSGGTNRSAKKIPPLSRKVLRDVSKQLERNAVLEIRKFGNKRRFV